MLLHDRKEEIIYLMRWAIFFI